MESTSARQDEVSTASVHMRQKLHTSWTPSKAEHQCHSHVRIRMKRDNNTCDSSLRDKFKLCLFENDRMPTFPSITIVQVHYVCLGCNGQFFLMALSACSFSLSADCRQRHTGTSQFCVIVSILDKVVECAPIHKKCFFI